MDTGLDQLRRAGLLFARGAGDQTTYTFKHALVQDAAYGTLLRAKRQEVHARIAHTLEREHPEICDIQPELLARHFQQAQLPERAIGYLQRAADRAAKRSAYREAIAHLRNALQLVELLPESPLREDQELQLLIALGPALMATKSSTAPEIGRVYARARELAQKAKRSADLFPSIWGAWLIAYSSSDFMTAQRLLEDLFSIAAAVNDPAFTLQAHHAAWPTYCSTGLLPRQEHTLVMDLHFTVPNCTGPMLCNTALMIPACAAMSLMPELLLYWAFWISRLHNWKKASPWLSVSAIHKTLFTHYHLLRRYITSDAIRSKWRLLLRVFFRCFPRIGSAVAIANAMMLRAWARVILGEIENGLAIMRDGLTAWRQTGSAFRHPRAASQSG